MMPAASTLAVRRHQPVPVDRRLEDEVLCDEAGRWGLYGEVVDQHLDEARHAITVVAPRRRQGLIAMRAQINRSRDHTVHEVPA